MKMFKVTKEDFWVDKNGNHGSRSWSHQAKDIILWMYQWYKNIMIIKNEMYNYLNVDLGLEIKENSIDEVYQLIWNHVIDEFL